MLLPLVLLLATLPAVAGGIALMPLDDREGRGGPCGRPAVAGGIALMPLDDRPATGHFPQMIARIAGDQLLLPPRQTLGRYIEPGDGAKLVRWLEGLDAASFDGLVVSVDMLAYGGLVASRLPLVSFEEARKRLEALPALRRQHPRLKIYAFNCVMRLAPTGRPENRAWRRALQRWASVVDEAEATANQKLRAEAAELRAQIPEQEMRRYLEARRRNHAVNLRMIEWVSEGVLDFLALSQDDARPYGLHRPEQIQLRERVRQLGVGDRVMVFPGADELGMVLVARVETARRGLQPRVAADFSSEKGKELVDPYEDRPIRETVEAQIRASGGLPAASAQAADLLLFVNVPQRTKQELEAFLGRLEKAVAEGRQVAVADVALLGKNGGPDPQLVAFLEQNHLLHRLAAFAGWNTTANTLGTVLPQAYAWLAANQSRGRKGAEPGSRPEPFPHPGGCDIAQAEFLFHRYVNDYGYHVVLRPGLHAEIRKRGWDVEHLTEEQYAGINRQAQAGMERFARDFFRRYFQPLGYRLKNLRTYLPWPRPFEVVIEVEFAADAQSSRRTRPR